MRDTIVSIKQCRKERLDMDRKESSLKTFIIGTDDPSEVNEDNIEQLLQPADGMKVPGRHAVWYYLCFVGKHGGGMRKHDRELPDNITITARHE